MVGGAAIAREKSLLLVIDMQGRLMPAISGGERVAANIRKLGRAATLLGVPVAATEQNPKGLGPTIPDLLPAGAPVFQKMTFDAGRSPGFDAFAPAGKSDLVVVGCEAHVCVLQTVLGLLRPDRRLFVVADAVASRQDQNRDAALRRMEQQGAQTVTAEMVLFEWLERVADPKFRDVLALIK